MIKECMLREAVWPCSQLFPRGAAGCSTQLPSPMQTIIVPPSKFLQIKKSLVTMHAIYSGSELYSIMHLSMVYPTWHTCMEQMLEEGWEFVIVIFPQGLVLSQDCSNPLKLYNHYSLSHIKCLWKICCETLYLPVTHCVQQLQGDMGFL